MQRHTLLPTSHLTTLASLRKLDALHLEACLCERVFYPRAGSPEESRKECKPRIQGRLVSSKLALHNDFQYPNCKDEMTNSILGVHVNSHRIKFPQRSQAPSSPGQQVLDLRGTDTLGQNQSSERADDL